MSTTLEMSQKELEIQVNTLILETKEFKVETDEDLQRADLTLLNIQDRLKKVSDLMDPVCESAHKAHKDATAARASLANPLLAAKTLITKVRGQYILMLENKRKAEEAEAKRIQAEAQVEADRKWRAEQAEALKKQEDDRLEKARILEANGNIELAEHILNVPPPPPPPPPRVNVAPAYIPQAAPTRTSGVINKETFKAEFESDPAAARAQLLIMVKAAAENPNQYLDFLQLNTSNINAHVKRTKGAVPVPGISITKEITTAVSSGRNG